MDQVCAIKLLICVVYVIYSCNVISIILIPLYTMTFCPYAVYVAILLQRPIWWRHQMEYFSALLALCARNLPVTGEFPRKGQWRGALMFSLVSAWINGWVNNHESSDLTRHRAHYDVAGIKFICSLRNLFASVCWFVCIYIKFSRQLGYLWIRYHHKFCFKIYF